MGWQTGLLLLAAPLSLEISLPSGGESRRCEGLNLSDLEFLRFQPRSFACAGLRGGYLEAVCVSVLVCSPFFLLGQAGECPGAGPVPLRAGGVTRRPGSELTSVFVELRPPRASHSAPTYRFLFC